MSSSSKNASGSRVPRSIEESAGPSSFDEIRPGAAHSLSTDRVCNRPGFVSSRSRLRNFLHLRVGGGQTRVGGGGGVIGSTNSGSVGLNWRGNGVSGVKDGKWKAGLLVKVFKDMFFTAYPSHTDMSFLPKVGTQHGASRTVSNLVHICVDDLASYDAFCLDFGPFNISNTRTFCEALSIMAMKRNFPFVKPRQIVIHTADDPQKIANGVFITCAYLMIYEGLSADKAFSPFLSMGIKDFIEPYRDATYIKDGFPLHIFDCLKGLQRAISMSWVQPRFDGFDFMSHDYFDHPLNGDIHEVLPSKFIAFVGPAGVEEVHDGAYKTFAAEYYAETFSKMGVTDIVRLNERRDNEYSPSQFTGCGMKHHDLIFEDCTPPPDEIVQKFLALSEKAKGIVAVHCKAGLGRTGTLIALYMMKHYHFTARESIGWLRFMRPGSVIHTQQAYLVEMETFMASGANFEAGGRRPAIGTTLLRSPFSSPNRSFAADDHAIIPSLSLDEPSVGKSGSSSSKEGPIHKPVDGITASSMSFDSKGNNSSLSGLSLADTVTPGSLVGSKQVMLSWTTPDTKGVGKGSEECLIDLAEAARQLAESVALDNTHSMRKRAAVRVTSPTSSPPTSPTAAVSPASREVADKAKGLQTMFSRAPSF